MADILRSPGYRSNGGVENASLPDIERSEQERSKLALPELHAILEEQGYAFARNKTFCIIASSLGSNYTMYYKREGFSRFPHEARGISAKYFLRSMGVLVWLFERERGFPAPEEFS